LLVQHYTTHIHIIDTRIQNILACVINIIHGSAESHLILLEETIICFCGDFMTLVVILSCAEDGHGFHIHAADASEEGLFKIFLY